MKSVLTGFLCFFSAFLFAQEIQKNPQNSTEKDTVKVSNINELEGVTIFGNKKQFIKVDSDKTTISIKENPMLSTGNALEAVKKLPGVITSPTSGLTLNSKGVTVFIDNAPSTLSGQDLQNYLLSLPANAIEKVELIYNPGAAFDANASGSVINIITSSTRMKGINASVNINYNFNKYQKPSPQILLNGKEKDLSWQTMLGYNYIESENRTTTNQTFTAFSPDKILLQENFAVNTQRNLYWRTGTNYKISNKSNVLLNYNMNLGNDRNVFDGTTKAENIDYFNTGIGKNKNQNHELSMQYRTKLDTLGRTLNVTGFGNLFQRNPRSTSDATDFISNEDFFNDGNTDFNLKNYYLKYDFDIPFEKYKFSVATGGKFNVLDVKNSGDYFINSPTANQIDFDYSENNLAFYAEARKKINKFSFTVGLRLEDFNVTRKSSVVNEEIKFRNTNLFPNISAIYEITDNINLSANYSKKINQPNYNTLDPNNGSVFDQYNSSQGNIFLNPTFFDNYEFKISAMQFIQLGANYTRTKDNNLFIFSADENATEPISNQTFQQFERFNTFSAYLNFPIPLDYFFKGKEEFSKRMNYMDKMNYIYLNINYVKNDIRGFDFPYSNEAIWNYSAQAQLMLPWDIKNTMTYFIVDRGNWEIYKITKPIQQFDISFNKDFMDKKLKVGIHCFDLFNSNEVNALVGGRNLNSTFRQKQDTRVFRISLTYNFGNLKLQKENTNIEVEKVQSGGGLVK
jgi:hypothetical protein